MFFVILQLKFLNHLIKETPELSVAHGIQRDDSGLFAYSDERTPFSRVVGVVRYTPRVEIVTGQ